MTTLAILGIAAAVVCLTLLLRPVLGAQLVALALPTGLIYVPGGVQVATVLSLMVIGIVAIRRLVDHRAPLPGGPMTWWAIVWGLGIAWSVALSPDPQVAVVFGTLQIIAAFTAVAWGELAGVDRLRPALVAWLLGGLIIAGSGVITGQEALRSTYGASVVEGRAIGVFTQPNEYGTYCMLVAVMLLGLAAMTQGWLRVLNVAVGATSTVGLVLSLSRGAWIGAAVGVVALALLAPRVRRPLAIGAGAIVVVAALLITLFREQPVLAIVAARIRSVFDPTENPYDNRPALLAEGVRQFLERPWLGQGPNMYNPVSTDVGSVARTIGGSHPHNLLVTTAAEQGAVGLIALVGMAVVVGFAVRDCRRTLTMRVPNVQAGRPRDLPLGPAVGVSAGAALVGVLASGLVDYPLRNALFRTVVWIAIGWVLAGRSWTTSSKQSPTSGASRPRHEAST